MSIQNYAYAQDKPYALNSELPCVHKKFYAYIHVSRDSLGKSVVSEENIREYLAQANLAFEPICISFDYCKIDFITDYSFTSIDDEVEIELLRSRFQQNQRLNIYFVNSVLSEEENSYSNFKGITSENTGIIIVPRTGVGLIHELGNTFGLLHTFDTKKGIESVDGKNCNVSGDLLCDTPADPYIFKDLLKKYLDDNCNFIYNKKDGNGDFYETEIGNYMTHYFCAHCYFTTSQYKIMADTYLKAPFKMW